MNIVINSVESRTKSVSNLFINGLLQYIATSSSGGKSIKAEKLSTLRIMTIMADKPYVLA